MEPDEVLKPVTLQSSFHGMRRLKLLAYLSVIGTYVLILVGGYVSASGSGLACPDWPTCNGQVIPALTSHVLIEYTHRLLALLVSVLVASTWLVVVLRYHSDGKILTLSTASLALLFAQVLLGMVTVRTELNAVVTAAHLGVASGVFALVLVNALLVRSRCLELVRQSRLIE